MIKNYLKIAFRNIIRYKGYSFLNITGLAIGIACFITIFLFIQYELSYDQYHSNKENIYRIVLEEFIGTPAPLAPACEKEIPEIKKSVRISYVTKSSTRMFGYKNMSFNENKFIVADPTFFEIFTCDFIKGNPSTALIDPNSIVISERMADKYFSGEDPIGKVLNYENKRDLIVTGVIKNVPENSHLQFDLVGQFPKDIRSGWGGFNYLTYLLLSENTSPTVVLKKIGEVLAKNTKQTLTKNPFLIQKLTDIHLNSHIRGEIGQNGYITDIYLYSAIALIVLMIACINYTNIVTSHYARRAKEIAVRKAIGANKRTLIGQFLSESMIFIIAAIFIALILFECFSPFISDLLNKPLRLGQLSSWSAIIGLLGITVFTAILSGSYPAFYLSSLNPVNVMKKDPVKIFKGVTLRKALIVLQFSFSIFFLIFTIFISQQMRFLNQAKLGFNKEHILNVPLGRDFDPRFETLKTELYKYPEVKQSSMNSFLLSGNDWNQNVWWEGLQENDWSNGMRWIPVDEDFVKTFELKLIKSMNYTYNKSDTAYILNESAVKLIGWKDPIGKKFDILGKGTVVGVVEDYHTKSLRDSIVPCALFIRHEVSTYLSIRISPIDISNTIKKIESTWKAIIPDRPFSYFFFDEDYNSLYKAEQQSEKIFGYTTALAIIISCLGLFGLVALAAEQKTKEIAVRKVLGSSVLGIVFLLSKDFTKLVIVANIVSWPIAYYLMNEWLQNFAYRIDLSVWYFILSALSVLLIALLTVGFQTMKAALANPVEALKYE